MPTAPDSARAATDPETQAARWLPTYERDVLPRIAALHRSVRRKYRVLVAVAMLTAATAWIALVTKTLDDVPIVGWVGLAAVVFVAGAVFVEAMLGLRRRIREEALGPLFRLRWPGAEYSASTDQPSPRLAQSGLFKVAGVYDIGGRLTLPDPAMTLHPVDLRRRVSSEPNMIRYEQVFNGLIFEGDVEWAFGAAPGAPLALASDEHDLPPFPGGQPPSGPPTPVGEGVLLWSALPGSTARTLPPATLARLEAFSRANGAHWRLILERDCVFGAVARTGPEVNLFVKAPPPDAQALRAELALYERAVALLGCLPLTPRRVPPSAASESSTPQT